VHDPLFMLPLGRLTAGPLTMSAFRMPPSAIHPLYWLNGVMDTWATSDRSRHSFPGHPRHWEWVWDQLIAAKRKSRVPGVPAIILKRSAPRAVVAEHEEDRVVVLTGFLEVVNQPADVEVEVLHHAGVEFHFLAEYRPGRRARTIGSG